MPLVTKSPARPPGQVEPEARTPLQSSLLEAYGAWASSYEEPNPVHALEERALAPLLPPLEGKLALDLACGTGRWLAKLVSGGSRSVAGLDLSPAMLSQAARKTDLQGRLARGDCSVLPFVDGVADLVLCSLAVGHVGDLQAFARELARVTRPGANIFLTDFHPLAHARGWRRTFRTGDKVLEVPSLARPVVEICRGLESEGCTLVRILEPSLGEPERRVFEQQGKLHLFDAACRVPLVWLGHFKRAGGKESSPRA